MKPRVKFSDNEILITYQDLDLKINTENNELHYKYMDRFADWKEIEFFSIQKPDFKTNYLKQSNKKRPKSRVKYFQFPTTVLGIDVSTTDYRLFFLLWDLNKFEKFRGKPRWTASYYINPYKKVKQFFEFDLSIPVREWDFNGVIKIIEPQKKLIESSPDFKEHFNEKLSVNFVGD